MTLWSRTRQIGRRKDSLGKGPKGIGEAYEQIQDLSMRMDRRDERKPWRCRVGDGFSATDDVPSGTVADRSFGPLRLRNGANVENDSTK